MRDKERELKELIIKLNERNNDSTLKDEIIFGLKSQINKQVEIAIAHEKENTDLKDKLKSLSNKYDFLKSDQEFLQKQVIESKR